MPESPLLERQIEKVSSAMADLHERQPIDDGEMTALRTVPRAFCAAARK
jgi:hypothetical protein